MKLSIIIPVYNEIAQLNKTIKKLISFKKKLKFELIFIDDFSSDGSFAYIKKYKKRFSFIKVFKNKKKGLGSAIETGIKNSKNDYVCFFMSDLSDDINDLFKYYKTISQNIKIDAVFGTRFSRKSKVLNYPHFKLFLNRLANNFIRLIFLSNYNDFTNAFKIYKKKLSLNYCLSLLKILMFF